MKASITIKLIKKELDRLELNLLSVDGFVRGFNPKQHPRPLTASEAKSLKSARKSVVYYRNKLKQLGSELAYVRKIDYLLGL